MPSGSTLKESNKEISSGRSSLVNVVKALGEYLTSEEDVVRGKGLAQLLFTES